LRERPLKCTMKAATAKVKKPKTRKKKETKGPLPGFNQAAGSRIQGASLPQTRALVPQLPLIKREESLFSKKLAQFVNMQIDPYTSDPVRLPDGFSDKTMIASSVEVWEISTYFPGTVNDGKFAGMVQPFLGGLDAVDQYATALVDSSTAWPTDFSAVATYMDGADTDSGMDPRISQYFDVLTQPSTAYLVYFGSNWSGSTAPLGATPLLGPFTYGLDAKLGFFGTNVNFIYLPPGQYSYSLFQKNTAGGLSTVLVSTNNNGFSYNSTNLVSTDSTTSTLLGVFTNPGTSLLGFANTGVAPTQSELTITPIFTPGTAGAALAVVADYGTTTQIRPLAMSVLGTSMVPALLEGGMMSVAYLPGAVADTQYFTNMENQTVGDLHSWEALAKLPNSYSAKWKDGFYAWWTYEDEDDYQFYQPSKALNNAFPTLAFAGQLVPQSVTATPPPSIPSIRLVVTRVFEILTLVRLYELDSCVGLRSEFEVAMQLLAMQPRCMMNDEHRSFIKRVMSAVVSAAGSARKFFDNNKSWIVPLGSALATALI